MSFVGIEFITDVADEGIIALVHHSWLTPLKKEVWWPPYKTGVQFKKALSFGEKPKDTWSICGIKRIFFSCDDLNKAYKKLIKCEDYSDIQSFPLEDVNQIKKRQRKRNMKYAHSSSEEEDSKVHRSSKISKFGEAGNALIRGRIRSRSGNYLTNRYINDLIPTQLQLQEDKNQERYKRSILSLAKLLCKSEAESVTPRSKISSFAEKKVTHSNASAASEHISTKENVDSQNQTAIVPWSSVSTNTNQSNSANSTFINQECKSCGAPHLCSFAGQIFEEIKKMKEEIKEIYDILKQSYIQTSVPCIPEDLPVEFPLETREQLEVLEDYLSSRQNKNAMSSYFSTLGGNSTTARTNKILKYILTNELATGFNFAGQKSSKEAFVKLHLKNMIIRSVQIQSPSTTESDVEKAIKAWLKHAPDRFKENFKRKSRVTL